MGDSLDVYPIGTSVLLDGIVSARITAIFIRENRVTYEVVWWNERERNEETIESWEIQCDGENSKSCRINPIL